VPASGLGEQEAAAFIAEISWFEMRRNRLGAWILGDDKRQMGLAYGAGTEATARPLAAPAIIELAADTDGGLPVFAAQEYET